MGTFRWWARRRGTETVAIRPFPYHGREWGARAAAFLLGAALIVGPASASVAAPTAEAAAPRARGVVATPAVIVVAMPGDEWVRFARTHVGAFGIGVFPDSRDGIRFLEEIGTLAPEGGSGDRGGPGALARDLVEAGVAVTGPFAGGEDLILRRSRRIGAALEKAFSAGIAGPEGLAGEVRLFQVPTSVGADKVLAGRSGPALVLGVGDRTPVWIEMLPSRTSAAFDVSATLVGSVARRPGVVTPYDLAATILDELGIPADDRSAGKALRREQDPDALRDAQELVARLERDVSYPPAVGATTVTLCILSLWAALLLEKLRRRELALRMAQAAAIVVPGWIVSQAVPSGRSELRLAVVAGAMVLAAISKPKNPMRTFGLIGVSVALAFAVVASIAPLHPGGEPGLSIWGNPLISWRFFGLANVPAVAIAAGIVVWGVMAGMQPVPLAVTSAAVAVILGAPTMGANFVGVLTFVFGAAAAVFALARKRFELWQLIVSGVLAVGAFVGALAADAGTPVSHGGRAARSIADGGVSALLDIVGDRLRLNLDLIREFGGGVIWAPAMLLIILALVAWGLRVADGPVFGRAAVLGGALMALASLVLEDSGFYSGGVLMVSAAAAWCLVRLRPQASDQPVAGG